MEPINILHHGAVSGVTGSCHQYVSESTNLLIDCGLFQGSEAAQIDLANFPFDVSRLNAVVLTHGHIDHIGRIPWLIAAGFRGPIICTKPTAKLLPIILRDALSFHIPGNDTLMNSVMARLERQIIGYDYNTWFKPDNTSTGCTRLRLRPAGHILGSAYIEIEENGHRTVFSGDLGSPGAVFVEPPASPERADTLIIETTYGDRLHTQRKEREQLLAKLINRALSDNGTLLIPAFSLGRTQELLSIIENLLHNGKISWHSTTALPVILDSPLAGELTSAYRSLANYWPEELITRRNSGRMPLAFDNLITVEGHSEHKKLVKRLAQTEQPAIVIAASGMCQGGRIMNYLEALLPLKTTEVLFVGYQAKGTLGSELQNSKPGDTVRVNDQQIEVNAQTWSISGFSAHADQADLLAFIEGIKPEPAEIRLVHGDEQAKRTFAGLIKKALPRVKVVVPG
ncbi:MBL fold metallo-hydrolase RNA specificity domain-containing protein [Reinekea marinisedimentorum]|uniref:Metallo-beta-lactamase family protein n=1 Tax=Reinekea marinisedimentorum TaxID=230495 RepID=A0A4V2UJX9_9GAMM|nr:MBL fold metallo-hydrolase [Reinekea marinisedimentorum]TCS41959.1 metallo-beta-lactamase family protein [Reinekea marinisedimentorum]